MAARAQAWANGCSGQHSYMGYGENIYITYVRGVDLRLPVVAAVGRMTARGSFPPPRLTGTSLLSFAGRPLLLQRNDWLVLERGIPLQLQPARFPAGHRPLHAA